MSLPVFSQLCLRLVCHFNIAFFMVLPTTKESYLQLIRASVFNINLQQNLTSYFKQKVIGKPSFHLQQTYFASYIFLCLLEELIILVFFHEDISIVCYKVFLLIDIRCHLSFLCKFSARNYYIQLTLKKYLEQKNLHETQPK